MKKILCALCLLATAACSNNEELPPYSLDYIPVTNNGECFYVDVKTGEKAEGSHVYSTATYFFDDIAIVADDDESFYFINKSFEKISDSKYIKLTFFQDGVAYGVKKNGHIEAIDKSGNVIFTLPNAEKAYHFRDGVSIFLTEEDDYGLVNSKGEILIQPGEYNKIGHNHNDGLLPVASETKRGLKWGVATYAGEEVIPCEYDDVSCRYGEDILVCDDDCWGVVDRNNKELIPIEYKTIYKQKDGNFLVEIFEDSDDETCWGWLDRDGKVMLEQTYPQASGFTDSGLAPIRQRSSDKFGYINTDGELVIDAIFRNATPFNDEDVAVVQNSREKYGLIDDKGEYLVNPRYDRIMYLGEGLYCVLKDELSGIINKSGEPVIKLSDENECRNPNMDVRNHVSASSDYLDIDDIVNHMLADANELAVDELTLSSYENKFDKSLERYGWITLTYSYNKYYYCEIKAYVDYEYDYNYNYEQIFYYITKLQVQYDILDLKLNDRKDEIIEKFASVINVRAQETALADTPMCDSLAVYDSTIVCNESSFESDYVNLSILPGCSGKIQSSPGEIALFVKSNSGVIRDYVEEYEVVYGGEYEGDI